MKLLWVCQGVPQLSDGSLLIAYELAKFLSKFHQQDLVFLRRPEELLSPPAFYHRVVDIPFKPDNNVVRRLQKLFSLRPHLVSYYAVKPMEEGIYRLTEEERYDIIIAMTINMAQYVYSLKAVKKIIMPHDAEHLIYRQILDEVKGSREKGKAWLGWKKVCYYQRKIYPFFDRCLVVSERDKTALVNLSARIKAQVLPSGVDMDFFTSAGAKSQRPHLVFTGVMNTWSNADAAVYFATSVFPLIKKDIPEAKFYIVGKRPSERVKKLAGEDIMVTGEVPDIRPYLEDAAVFVAPFRMGTGLKHKILEAMAMGLPVVSTTLGANGLEIEPGKNIILADHPADFAAAVTGLLNNKIQRQALIKEGWELVKNRYSWTRVGERMEDILAEVLRN